jgi:hypothetical protein
LQLELQEVEQHKGLQSLVAKDAMTLLHNMVAMPWPGAHTCQDGLECQFCEMAVLWYQLALEIVEKLAPQKTAIPPDVIYINVISFMYRIYFQFIFIGIVESGWRIWLKILPRSKSKVGCQDGF